MVTALLLRAISWYYIAYNEGWLDNQRFLMENLFIAIFYLTKQYKKSALLLLLYIYYFTGGYTGY